MNDPDYEPERSNPEHAASERGSTSGSYRSAAGSATAFVDLADRLRAYVRREDAGGNSDIGALGWCASAVTGAVETEIIPRLMLAHRAGAATARSALEERDHQRFLAIIRHESVAAAKDIVQEIADRGVPIETIFLDLLTRSARALGEMWERDEADFTEVTVVLCRLHEILRAFSPAFQSEERDPETGGLRPRILMATACGDQHILGVLMAAEFFRRAGWVVSCEAGASLNALERVLRETEFDVIGLSGACGVDAVRLQNEIEKLRRASRNSDVKVIVGGRLFAESPELAAEIGADAVAVDAAAAPDSARLLLASSAAHC